MSNPSKPKTTLEKPVNYQIRIEGHLGEQWTDWFEGLTVSLEETGVTCLTGPIADQAALYGVLKKIRDLGMPLVSVNQMDPGHPVPSRTHPSKTTKAITRSEQ